FGKENRKEAAADAKTALAALAQGKARSAELGDPFLVAAELHDTDKQAIANQFGGTFANRVFELQPGEWSGPIESTYGLHLVRVSELKPGRSKEFAEVKSQVLEH